MSDLLPDIRVEPSSYVDPNGRLYWSEGRLYRVIEPHVAEFYRDLVESGYVGELTDRFGMVPTRLSSWRHPVAQSQVVLEHDVISPLTYCVEWCPSMLKDAAASTIALCQELLGRELTIQDAYPWNIVYQGPRPVFVDVTSIVPLPDDLIWPAYNQFMAFFVNPLQLAAAGKGDVARARLFDYIGGVSRVALSDNAPLRAKLSHPSIPISAWLERLLEKRKGLLRAAKRASAKSALTPSHGMRERFFERLRRKVEAFRFASGGDVWEGYYADIPAEVDRQAKLSVVEELLNRLAPASVVDLGANTGPFSILAAKAGADVLSIDSSEACMDALYRTAKVEDLRITPVIADVLAPTPAFGFLSTQFPSLMERAVSDGALCLGLMHHLHIAGRQPFDRIADLLSRLARRFLIFEYVDMSDANNELISAGRPIQYDLESVQAALGVHFSKITQFDSDRDTRKLLLCEKPS